MTGYGYGYAMAMHPMGQNMNLWVQRVQKPLYFNALVFEICIDIAGVTGSIPVVPTIISRT